MARIKYFADTDTGTLVFERVDHRGREGTFGYDATQGWVRTNRAVQMKSNPTRHECDARCYNATGRTMQCECSCGGKNHGKGAFNCSEAA